VIIPRESAWYVVNELGKMNCVDLVDMTPEEAQMSRPYFPMIRRIEDVLGKLAHIESEMAHYNIKNIKCRDYARFLCEIQN
jgi:V-type H+-transporting ATPase subunit a